MNFTNFSFWWILFLLLVPLLRLRQIGKGFKLWNPTWDRLILLSVSLALFYNASPTSWIIFLVELCFNYFLVRLMFSQVGWRAISIATFAICFDLGVLIYFKYLNFFVQAVLQGSTILSSATALGNFNTPAGNIPPGISFYTFQMVAFIVDSWKDKKREALGFLDYLNFVSFFPQIVAGPIERRSDLLPQIKRFELKLKSHQVEEGIQWLAIGFFMKLVLADNLALHIQLDAVENPYSIWLSIFLFGLRIYFDFAGYSFIAYGLALVIGIKLTVNFLAPYTATDIQSFWRRWHVTLSSWFRDYVFIPLGGSRVPWAAANILAVFAISGLWHGAGWNFILWGSYHGALLILHRYLRKIVSLPSLFNWLLTLALVMTGWLFFMETDSDRLFVKLGSMISLDGYAFPQLLDAVNSINNILHFVFFLTLSLIFLALENLSFRSEKLTVYHLIRKPFIISILLGMTVLFVPKTVSQFVYFAF